MNETVPALLRAAAQRWGDKPALKSMSDAPTSFAKLDRFADLFAKALIGDGMSSGERIGIWAPNMWEWVASAVGAQRAGGAIVPLNPRLRAAEAEDILVRAQVSRLVTVGSSHNSDYAAMSRRQALPKLRRVILLRDDQAKSGGEEQFWDEFLKLGNDVTAAVLHNRENGVTGDSISDILFTSGTTGKPKGAVFSHDRTVRSGHGMKNFASVSETDCLCPLGPFAHFAGYKGGWLNGLVTGATVCWSEAHDAESLLNAIATMGITVMPAPPIVWQDILDHPNRGDWNLSSLRFAATGSSMIPPQLVMRLASELNIGQVGTGYGMTESGGMTNYTRPEDSIERVAYTAGRPSPDSEVCIADPNGKRLGTNEPGEILVRNKRLMLEYLDDPDATHTALDAEGWLHTGDVGTIDEDSYLRITDRVKDMYITNGYNVYPAELEQLISTMPGIVQCAVIGVPDTRKGEVGHAFLVRSTGSTITKAEVIDWCKQNIASYKIPAGVTFLDYLPRNSQGKVLKQELPNLI